MRLPRMADCRDCADPIRFVTMPTGKHMPVNPAPLGPLDRGRDSVGTVAAALAGHVLVGYVISHARGGDGRHPLRFRPHAATCTAARPATPEREPDPHLF